MCGPVAQWIRHLTTNQGITVVSPQVRFAPSRFAPTKSRFALTQSRFALTQSRFAPTQSRFAPTKGRFAPTKN